jgi:hypothetical protein
LAEGTDDNIHDADIEDVLRVDAQGSNFSFHINDQLVSQITDADYAVGEVGLFVQSFDSVNTHVHFDELTIRTFEAALVCDVQALALNIRSGPGTNYSSTTFLSSGDTILPLGRSADQKWLLIRLEESEKQGWVFNADEFVSCTGAIDLLPIVNP